MELITQSQVCVLLGVTKRTLSAWRCWGFGPKYCKLSRRSVMYPKQEVEAYIANSLRASTSEDLNHPAPSFSRKKL